MTLDDQLKKAEFELEKAKYDWGKAALVWAKAVDEVQRIEKLIKEQA